MGKWDDIHGMVHREATCLWVHTIGFGNEVDPSHQGRLLNTDRVGHVLTRRVQYQRWCVEVELDRRIGLKFAVGGIVRVKIFEVRHGGDRSLVVPIRPK